MGNFRKKFGRRGGHLATLALALLAAAPGYPPEHDGPRNFLELVGVVPPAPTDITYVTFNSNLGDDTIYHFSRLYELHRLYPEARIHFLSPLRGQPRPISPWLDPVTIAPSGTTTLTESAENFALTHAGEHSLFMMPDLNDHADMSEFLKAKGIPYEAVKAEVTALPARMEKLAGQLSARGGSTVLWDVTRSSDEPGLDVHYARPGTALQKKVIPGADIPYRPIGPLDLENHTQYERTRIVDRALLFGAHDLGTYPKAMVYSPGEGVADFEKWRAASFVHPGEKHIVVSLNGGGEEKVEALRPQYGQLLEEILRDVWHKNPKTNIVVPFPEAQFGPEVGAQVREVIGKYPGHAALLPAGRFDMIGAAIDTSYLTIAHDGGTAHIARGIAGARRVLTFSVNDASLDWRDTGQLFAIHVDARTAAGQNAISLKVNLAMDIVAGPTGFQYRVSRGLGMCEKQEIIDEILWRLNPETAK